MRHAFVMLWSTVASLLLFTTVTIAQTFSPSQMRNWGHAQGEGRFSLLGDAHALQLSGSLDVPASITLRDSKIKGHTPIIAADLLLRAWRSESKAQHSVWLGAAFKPMGVSAANPGETLLKQTDHVLNELTLIGFWRVGDGELRVESGVVTQHLGREDTLYWTTLRPIDKNGQKLRLFDTGLGLNTTYAYRSLITRIKLGSPIERNVSPFASSRGFGGQLELGWTSDEAHVVLGARQDLETASEENELNLQWAFPFAKLGIDAPLALFGEFGILNQPDRHQNAMGALYAHHELAVLLTKFSFRVRYDWTDDDTVYKYDTHHLVRVRADFKLMKYLSFSTQFRHRWQNTEERTHIKNDDILLFLRCLY